MSMDIEVWSAIPVLLPEALPQAGAWKEYGIEFAYESDGWQILVSTESAEPSSEVLAIVPEARNLTNITLEPIGASKTGYKMLEIVTMHLASELNGCWVDPSGRAHPPGEGSF